MAEPWRPRESIRLRLDQALGEPPARGLAEGIETRSFARQFSQALTREGSEVLTALAEELATLERPGLSSVQVQIDASDWSANGAARTQADGSIALSLSFGFLLAVEEATLEFLSHDDALCPRAVLFAADDQAPLPSPLHPFAFEAAGRAGRFCDYRTLKRRRFGPEAVTGRFPADLWRLRQQDLLFRLFLRWAALHEIAYAALGHPLVLAACFGQGEALSIAEAEPSFPLTSEFDNAVWERFGYTEPPDVAPDQVDLRRVMELHADTCALWLAIDLELSGRNPLFATFETDMAAPGADPATCFASFDAAGRVYLLALAAMGALVLFEVARRRRAPGASTTHPLPEARIITLVDAAFYGSPDTRPDGEGGFQILISPNDLWAAPAVSGWNRFIQDTIAPAIEDLNFLAETLELDFPLVSGAPKDLADLTVVFDGPAHVVPHAGAAAAPSTRWWSDLIARQRAAVDPSAGALPPPLSAGGRELAGLDSLQPHVNYLSDVLQIALHGGVLGFSAADRTAPS